MRCRMCGCTDNNACNPPCSWAPGRSNLCSSCLVVAAVVAAWEEIAVKANFAALKREVGNAADLPAIRRIDLQGR